MASRVGSLRAGSSVPYRPFLLLFLLLLLLPASRASASEPEVPPYRGYVTDTAGILGDWSTEIESLCRDIERETTAEVAVLTVRSTAPLPAQAYAQKVFDRWKIGKKGKDNGVLVLVAADDRQMWIATGYGVEAVLPDGKAGEIRDQVILPLFRREQYGEGIYKGVQAIGTILGSGTVEAPKTRPVAPPGKISGCPDPVDLLFFLIVGGYTILRGILSDRYNARRRRQGRGGYGGPGGFWGGGFGGGGFGGGGFGGFGGGFSGGGGAGGGW